MMKKVALLLSVLSLTGALYAGDGCCGTKKAEGKTEKKVCGECSKVEGSCDACKAKKAEKTKEKKD